MACLVAAVKSHFPNEVVIVELRIHSAHVLESTRLRRQHCEEGGISGGRLDGPSSFSLRREHLRQTNGPGELVCDVDMRAQQKSYEILQTIACTQQDTCCENSHKRITYTRSPA